MISIPLRHILVLLLISSIPISSFAATGTILKPSIQTQMKLQSIQDKKAANIARLLALRNKKLAGTNSVTTTQPTIPGKATSVKPTIPNTSPLSYQPTISGVDMTRVRTAWIGWYNDVRKNMGLGTYSYDGRLDKTAYSWDIEFAKGKGQNHHRRNPNDAYYDYPKITEWFKDRGVMGKVVNGATTTENVGWGTYSCSSGDCTDALISSIRTTFDFFMSEKSYNGAHYRSVVQSGFTKIGLSVIVEPSERRYYLVVHYITEFQ